MSFFLSFLFHGQAICVAMLRHYVNLGLGIKCRRTAAKRLVSVSVVGSHLPTTRCAAFAHRAGNDIRRLLLRK
jgi:hypothetical protein